MMQDSLPADFDAAAATPAALAHDVSAGSLHTEVTRPVAWALVLSFLLAIAALPLSQLYLERRAEEESPLTDLFRRAPTAENLACSCC
jgi:hypothetical protein